MASKTRDYLLTINNPEEHGLTKDELVRISTELDPVYFCLSEEVGLETGTPHTHIYISFKNPRGFNAVRTAFKEIPHIDQCFGTPAENRDYVFKTGKWEGNEKEDTNIKESHFEYGELPERQQGKRSDIELLHSLVKEGLSTFDIIDQYPQYSLQKDKIDGLVAMYKTQRFKSQYRQMKVTYIWGDSRTGKTSYVTKKHGYENVYRVNDYKNPFDGYEYQDIILFDEFRSSIEIERMLTYLEGHPCMLPCRFNNRQACFTQAYIVSNISLEDQFRGTDNATFDAFLNRISAVMCFERNRKTVLTDKRDFIRQSTIEDPKQVMTLEEYEEVNG